MQYRKSCIITLIFISNCSILHQTIVFLKSFAIFFSLDVFSHAFARNSTSSNSHATRHTVRASKYTFISGMFFAGFSCEIEPLIFLLLTRRLYSL